MTKREEQNWQALAKAVKERRRELGMTQPELTERSRRLDLELHPDAKVKNRGLSVRTWSEIERAIEKERRGRTQWLVDATLEWPRGTAKALLQDEPLPTGPSLTSEYEDSEELPPEWETELESLRGELESLRGAVDEVKAQMRVERLRLELEIAELKAAR